MKAEISNSVETTIEGDYHEHTTTSYSARYERPDRIPSGQSWNIAIYSFNEKAKLYDKVYDSKSPYRN